MAECYCHNCRFVLPEVVKYLKLLYEDDLNNDSSDTELLDKTQQFLKELRQGGFA